MKKPVIFGLIIIAIIACGLLFRQQVKLSRDREFKHKLAGTWSWEFNNERDTNAIASDGSYDEQLISTNSKGVKLFQFAGTWQIKNGIFIETVTNDSRARARVPRIKSAQIVRVDVHEFVIVWPDPDSANEPVESVWQKVSQ
jgi:hypothetical protein